MIAAPTNAREIPVTDRKPARRNADAEYAALVETVRGFEPEDWSLPTDCEGWTVRDMVAHLTGAAHGAVSTHVADRRR